MQRALNLDASPPLSYALRFFITAPAFIFFAALLLLYAGPNALTSRWHPSILAITHLLALGAVAQTMIGALLQILPVATGIHIFHQGWPVWVIYLGLNIGTLLLAQAFLSYQPFYFIFATLSLTLSFFVFLSFSIWGLWRDREQQTKGAPTILRAVRFAIIALIVTVFLGVILTSHFIISIPLNRWLTNLHASWGLLGWVGLLVVGISFQVIPIFQVTERYPDMVRFRIAQYLFGSLVLFSISFFLEQSALFRNNGLFLKLSHFFFLLILFLYAVYAMVTLHLLLHRKRPKPDTTTLFWYCAQTCLFACFIFWVVCMLAAPLGLFQFTSGFIELTTTLPIILGCLALYGFAWSAINGMLYTILPFLLWYNAQRQSPMVIRHLPKVRNYMPDKQNKSQFYIHLISIALMFLVFFGYQNFFYPTIFFVLISVLFFYVRILFALRKYMQAKQLIKSTIQNEMMTKKTKQ